MSFVQRRLRIFAVLAALAALVSFGLADWSGSSGGTYVVRPGDSLWAIATGRGLTVAQLAAANGMNPQDILLIGRHLVIPSGTAPAAAPATTGAVANPVSPTGSVNAAQFCSTFRAPSGPTGVLPSPLAGSATYDQLRPLFVQWAAHYGLSLPLLEAVAWQESGWQQNVVSVTGAIGVGQIEPYTATFIDQQLVGLPLDPKASVSDNIRMSAAFLAYLAHLEGNNRCATIAAYYEGPVNLQTIGVLPDAQRYVASVEALEPRFD